MPGIAWKGECTCQCISSGPQRDSPVSRPQVCRQLLPGKGPFQIKAEDSTKQIHAVVVSRGAWSSAPAPLWIPSLIPPLPPAPAISSGCQVSLLPADTSQLPRFPGSSQVQTGCQCGRTPGRAVAGSGSGTRGDEAKCCKEGSWEARGLT